MSSVVNHVNPFRECLVLGGFHDFALARTLVVDAAQVQDAMDDDAVQLGVIRGIELFGIGAHRVEADKQVARNAVSFGIVEGDDVGVIIVLQVLAVHLQYLLIGAEDVGYFGRRLSPIL